METVNDVLCNDVYCLFCVSCYCQADTHNITPALYHNNNCAKAVYVKKES